MAQVTCPRCGRVVTLGANGQPVNHFPQGAPSLFLCGEDPNPPNADGTPHRAS